MQPVLHVEPRTYMHSFPRFDQPKVIGFIELENLKFANHIQNNKEVRFDLNHLLDEAKHKPLHFDPKLTDLLRFLLEQEIRLKFPLEKSLESSPFFCYRGLMTCLGCTPYENREPWKIVAVLYKGNIYLCARDTEEKINRKLNMTDKEKRFTSWGYKFEQYILSDKPYAQPNPNIPVDECEEFSLVFKTRLKQHTIIYGAEMDGIRCDKDHIMAPPSTELGAEAAIDYLSNKEFVELKTNRHIEFPNQEKNFRRFKTIKWWLQSFLAGIQTIQCGCRNDNGIVEELKVYQLKDLVNMSQKFWNPSVCFNFLDTFLVYVKRCLAREIEQKYGTQHLKDLQSLPLISLLFEWRPGQPIKVVDSYKYEDDPILPTWFIDAYGKKLNC